MDNQITTFIIKGPMTSLNPYINLTRHSRYAGADAKKQETGNVTILAKNQKLRKFDCKVNIKINIYTRDLREDEDNLFIYCKWILDGLVDAGVIVSDSRKYVHVVPEVFYDGQGERVEVIIKRVETG